MQDNSDKSVHYFGDMNFISIRCFFLPIFPNPLKSIEKSADPDPVVKIILIRVDSD